MVEISINCINSIAKTSLHPLLSYAYNRQDSLPVKKFSWRSIFKWTHVYEYHSRMFRPYKESYIFHLFRIITSLKRPVELLFTNRLSHNYFQAKIHFFQIISIIVFEKEKKLNYKMIVCSIFIFKTAEGRLHNHKCEVLIFNLPQFDK